MDDIEFYDDCENCVGVAEGEPGNVVTHSHEGVTFQEETKPQVQRAFRGRVAPVSKLGDIACPDEHWDLDKMVLRPTLVGSLKWSTASTVSNVIGKFRIPQDLLTSSLLAAPFQKFNFWKGNVTVRVQLNGTPFHVGKLIMFYVPLTSTDVIERWHLQNFAAATSVPHVFIDAASSTVAELEIPFLNPQGFLRINGSTDPNIDYLGYVYIAVFNPLLVTTGSSAILSMAVWTEMTQCEFKIPNVTGTVPAAINYGTAQGEIGTAEGAIGAIGMGLLSSAGGSIMKSLMGNSIISGIKSVWDIIRDATRPKNIVGDQFDTEGEARASSMDRPNDSSDPPRFVRQPLQYMSHNIGVECLDRLAMDPSSQNLSTFAHFGSTVDEMSLKYLTTLPTFDTTLSWTTALVDGSKLYTRLVGPNAWTMDASVSLDKAQWAGSTFRYNPTLFEYISMPYAFWRGGIKFRITITASKFHTGRLWVSMSYGTTNVPLSLAQAMSQYGMVIDLQDQQQEWTFVVPYQHVNPWCRMPHGPITPASGETVADQVLGTLSVWVLNSLAVPDAVAPSVYINIFRSGAEDYELSYPSQGNTSFTPINYGVTPAGPDAIEMGVAEGDSGAGVSDQAATMEAQASNDGIVLAPSRARVHADNHFQDTSRSIRDDIKRYTPLFPFVGAPGEFNYGGNNVTNKFNYSTGLWTLAVAPPLHIGEGNQGSSLHLNNFTRGLFGWYSCMYRFWRGSLRYRFLFDLPNPTQRGLVTFDPHYWTQSDGTNSGQVVTNMDMTQAPYMGGGMTYMATSSSNFTGAGPLNPTNSANNGSSIACPRGSNIPFSVADFNAPYCDIEVPFQTNYNVALMPIERSNVTTLNSRSSSGTLMFGTMGIPNQTNLTAPTTGGSVWLAAGDDFRMGFLMGPPTITMRGVYTYQQASGFKAVSMSSILPDRYATFNYPGPQDEPHDYYFEDPSEPLTIGSDEYERCELL